MVITQNKTNITSSWIPIISLRRLIWKTVSHHTDWVLKSVRINIQCTLPHDWNDNGTKLWKMSLRYSPRLKQFSTAAFFVDLMVFWYTYMLEWAQFYTQIINAYEIVASRACLSFALLFRASLKWGRMEVDERLHKDMKVMFLYLIMPNVIHLQSPSLYHHYSICYIIG